MSGSLVCHRSTQVSLSFFFPPVLFYEKDFIVDAKKDICYCFQVSLLLPASSCVTLHWRLPLLSALVGSGTMTRKGTPVFCALKSKCTTLSCPPHFAASCGCSTPWFFCLLWKYSYGSDKAGSIKWRFCSVARNLVGICFSSVGVPSFWLRGRMFLLHQMLVNFVER